MEFGLGRVSAVARQLGLLPLTVPCITVGGTNGKGSTVASLEALLLAHDLRVGCHTSPHLLRYNERVRINGEMATDAELIRAFVAIEQARGQTPLTYFEFGALAALWLFAQTTLDVVVLEVGLGGRLDAVNMVDASVAIITSIDLDHQQWLGDDREQIGREKAGIFRRHQPVVIGDPDPPASVLQAALALDCRTCCLGEEFSAISDGAAGWCWRSAERQFDKLPRNGLQLSNMACAIQALLLLDVALQPERVRLALGQVTLAARQQLRYDASAQRELLLDVAHNPHAARALQQRLLMEKAAGRKIHVVLAIMADKDAEGFIAGLESVVDFWYSAQVDQPRCLPAVALQQLLQARWPATSPGSYESVATAYTAACANSLADDLIVVCGSFFTVSAMMQILDDLPPRHPGR